MQKNQSGGALPLIMLILSVMLSFLAFIINSGMLSIARDQSQHFSRIATLGAIEEYFDHIECEENGEEKKCSPQQRYDFALQRAQEILAENGLIGNEYALAKLVDPGEAGDQAATLFPGTWYTEKIDEGTDNEQDPPCGEVPCFDPMTFPLESTYSIDNLHPNAFRISGTLYSDSPIKFASKLLGGGKTEIKVESIASLVPRRGCFLVDISNSMVRETHHRWKYELPEFESYLLGMAPADYGPATDGVAGFGNEFAYFLDACDGFPAIDGVAGSGGSNWFFERQCGTYFWMSQEKPARDPNLSAVANEHYADDYIEKITLSDADYASYARKDMHPNPGGAVPPNDPSVDYGISDDNLRYNIDLSFINNPDPAYTGPQPLAAVFKGLQTAIKQLRNRKVAGDMLCVIFYDQSLKWPRVINITDDFDALLEYTRLDDIGDNGNLIHPLGIGADADPQDPHVGADGGALAGAELAIRHHLFPGVGSYTSTITALDEAMSQIKYIKDSSKVPSSDFLVLIGDGLTNCLTCPSGCTDCQTPCYPSCSNNLDWYNKSMAELQWFVQTYLVPSEIQTHVILTGDVAPHTRFIYGIDSEGKNRCLSDKEAMRNGILPANGGVLDEGSWIAEPDDVQKQKSFSTSGANNAFLEVNRDMAKIAMMTGGIWAPLRPQVGSQGSCTEYNSPDNCGSPNAFQFNDPFCRTAEQQMIDAVEEILGTNPFELVEVQ